MNATESAGPQTLTRYTSLEAALEARAALEGSGIEAWVPDENIAGLEWRWGVALGFIRLQVRPEEVEAAREVLGLDVEGEAVEEDPEVAPEATEPASAQDVCPACGSERLRPDPQLARLKASSLIFWPLFLVAIFRRLVARDTWECEACGHVWRVRKP